MKILILHRIPFHKIDYDRGINHDEHDVTYFGTKEALSNIPLHLRARKIERPGKASASDEALILLGARADFDRVISLSEYELLEAARLREEWGVSGPKRLEVLLVRDKVMMKKAVARAGLRVPRHIRLSELNRSSECISILRASKLVLKPVSGASSENVQIVQSFQEAWAAFQSMGSKAQAEDFELEEFIDGPILHIDGLVQDGKILCLTVSQYLGTCLDYAKGLPLGSFQIETTSLLEEFAHQSLSAVSLRDGSFHLEVIQSIDGLAFLEVGARVGGADVVDTFELRTGIHMPSEELKIILGEVSQVSASTRDKFFGWFVFPGHHLPEGSARVSGEKGFRHHSMIHRWNQLSSSDFLPRKITYQAREVPVAGIVQASRPSDLKAFMQSLFETVRVEATPFSKLQAVNS